MAPAGITLHLVRGFVALGKTPLRMSYGENYRLCIPCGIFLLRGISRPNPNGFLPTGST
ncbi:hypothetical protein DICSQDRAFT_154916 [Dichomitus squalens LYAD-421 SS1]|uniref:Uncharacterized protein n=1 Tax=Dichomitus squalens (strain LYAD-421) TaxID=732165 RepID=R7T1H5_DICSQ|nr:uncharacterized protein DICSQDRAFT_154916 [Dichomitus squalens LYAD-421 SS1]EJF62113.1 hypothetical protein DICSQDRAFT_154916 [Dichomitus squalens LYAD-421 SS1]